MPGGGMVGSFKSTVWDYYLPTDMHEASFISKVQCFFEKMEEI
jgi:hypothetical protein